MKTNNLIQVLFKRIIVSCLFVFISGLSFAVSIKFTVDMSYQIKDGSFNASSDKVYLRGSFCSWDTSNQMISQGDGVYSITLNLQGNSTYYFKFFTNAPEFSNSGWESNAGVGMDDRYMTIGTNNLELAKIYFNNANMKLRASTENYKIYCDDVDVEYVDTMVSFYNDHFTRITNAIETKIGSPVNIWFYPDQKTYFIMYGYPESPSWAIGSAIGRDHIVTFSPRYFANLEDCLGNTCHEFTHSSVAWKMGSQMPVWLNEGAACFYAGDGWIRPIGSVRYNVTERRGGSKPPLSYIEEGDFAENDGYPLSHSVADFIFTKHGQHAMADFIETIDYAALGYSSKLDFQNSWHQHLDKYYLDPQADMKIYVDMSDYISKGLFNPKTDKVSIGGDFSHWFTFGMLPEENGIYSFVTTCPYNETLNYKFRINSAGAPDEGWEKNVGQGVDGSRILNVLNSNLTTSFLAFNSVESSLHEVLTVTFSVDLNYQISNKIFNPSKDRVYIKGSFNGWGEQNKMTDEEGDGIYSCIIELDPLTNYEYKYFITSAGAENSGWEMTVGTGNSGNRSFKTGTGSMVLDKEYYNNKVVSSNDIIYNSEFKVCPNHFSNSTVISFNVEDETFVSLKILDLNGRIISKLVDSELKEGIFNINWDTSSINKGIYFCVLTKGNNSFSTKMLVK